LLSVVGDDDSGKELIAQGTGAGIDMSRILTTDTGPTPIYLSILNDVGEMAVAVADMQILDQLDANYLQEHREFIRAASLIIIDSNLPESALQWIAENCSDKIIFADPVSTRKSHNLLPYLAHIHTFTPGWREAQSLADIEMKDDNDLEQIAQWFHDQGVQQIFITLGERGIFYSVDGNRGFSDQNYKPEIRNTGGAGDALLAGLAYSWLAQWDLQTALIFAETAAAITTESADTINPLISLDLINTRSTADA
jgi:pseudouridine kinase